MSGKLPIVSGQEGSRLSAKKCEQQDATTAPIRQTGLQWLAVEGPVLNRFAYMMGADRAAVVEIGDGARDLLVQFERSELTLLPWR